MKKKLLFLKNNPQEILHREKVNERLRFAAAHDVNTVLKYLLSLIHISEPTRRS